MSATSERYQGLNLPDLMELMHDLVWPDPVAMTPQTPGWWVLLGWLVALALLVGRRWLQHRRSNRYRRQALVELKAIAASSSEQPFQAAARVSGLLKRTALAAYPRVQVAGLYGSDWASFLGESSCGDARVTEVADQIASAPYRCDVDGRQLLKPAERWIRRHRVSEADDA